MQSFKLLVAGKELVSIGTQNTNPENIGVAPLICSRSLWQNRKKVNFDLVENIRQFFVTEISYIISVMHRVNMIGSRQI